MDYNNDKILLLGYNESKTRLVKFIREYGHSVECRADKIQDLSGYGVVISFGYRHILSKEVLKTSRRPVINLHISYLPYNRGSHPNFWSFVDNTPSGVTIHEIDEGIDTGPIIYQKKISFGSGENTFSATHSRLTSEIEILFLENIDDIISGNYSTSYQTWQGTYHSVKDLPIEIKDWNVDINETIKLIKNKDRNLKTNKILE